MSLKKRIDHKLAYRLCQPGVDDVLGHEIGDKYGKPRKETWRNFVLREFYHRRECEKCGKQIPIKYMCCEAPIFVWPWWGNTENKQACRAAYDRARNRGDLVIGTSFLPIANFYYECPADCKVVRINLRAPFDLENLRYEKK